MQRNAFPNNFQGSRIKEHRFVFDKLFDVHISQNNVYHHTHPLLDSILDVFNPSDNLQLGIDRQIPELEQQYSKHNDIDSFMQQKLKY
ncbi:uncharacterized protein RJT21DRAFT_4161 [Scheffersomyces amazonensis]|uniref:uncharacterized protein n=1 Tax=Scheffersomyces amazonensis TaxID=1078765 RepID=UPI00315C5B4C